MTAEDARTWVKMKARFPYIPERTPDDMTTAKAIHLNGSSYLIGLHFSGHPNTVLDAER